MPTNNGKKAKETPETTPEIKWKIPPERVLSDDCEVRIGRVIEDGEIINEGVPWKVHEGEWVEIMPVRTLREIMALQDITDDGSGNLRTLCTELSNRITGWNWTGMDRQPLPSPYHSPEVLEFLTDDELVWLLGAARGQETSAERKNA